MDDVIDFSNLSLKVLPVSASGTPASASSGAPVSLFSTPLSASSGSTGDRIGSSVGMFYCRDSSAPCCGVIANSGFNRFCLKTNCEVKAHRTQKVIIKVGNLYILGTRKDQALFCSGVDGVE
jgi:hypothetical protein